MSKTLNETSSEFKPSNRPVGHFYVGMDMTTFKDPDLDIRGVTDGDDDPLFHLVANDAGHPMLHADAAMHWLAGNCDWLQGIKTISECFEVYYLCVWVLGYAGETMDGVVDMINEDRSQWKAHGHAAAISRLRHIVKDFAAMVDEVEPDYPVSVPLN